jgi:hypothetical protein
MRRVSESGMHGFKYLTAAKAVLGRILCHIQIAVDTGLPRILRADGYDQRSEIDYRELNQDS